MILSLLVGGSLAAGAVSTNALGVGESFEGLQRRIALIIDPPPNRPTRPTITVTPPPVLAATGTPRPSRGPTLAPPLPGAPGTEAPTPEPTPEPTPRREPVDVNILRDSEPLFSSQLTKEWCAPAGVQMVLMIHGLVDGSPEVQTELANEVETWESWQDSHNGGWGPAAMVEALDAYGATGYEIRAYETRTEALRDSARAISETGAPAILLAWRGAHTWVMTGYRANADPTVFADATVAGAYVLDPWYPRVSSIWGASDPAGTYQDPAEMKRNFLPWRRPEGLYPERDGKYIVVIPTQPLAR